MRTSGLGTLLITLFSLPVSKGEKQEKLSGAAGSRGQTVLTVRTLTQQGTEWTPGIETHFVLRAGGLKWLW